MSDRNIYGEVNSVTNIREINRKIRDEIRGVRDRAHLTELKKRSDYLCTLTQSPAWQEKFGSKSRRMLAVAKEEDHRTTRLANSVARRNGLGANYDPWGN
jgi:hypothetical protein